MIFYLDAGLIPPKLSNTEKNRLQEALKQFAPHNSQYKVYNDFYSSKTYDYFLQGDIVREIRFPKFDKKLTQYSKEYFDCLLLSNTCDMDENNKRRLSKEVLICKLIPFSEYQNALNLLFAKDTNSIIQDIKNQQYSNILYLPPNNRNQEYIAFLDEISFITLEELNNLKSEIIENRISSLDFFGYYLFLFKLSYHLMRLPEETHR